MEFELAPNNRDQPDTVLLEDLRRASDKMGHRRLTREAYSEVGRFSASTIAKRFRGWGRALIAAGLKPSRHFAVSRDECIVDLRRVAEELEVDTVTVAQYRKLGQYSNKVSNGHFNGWVQALKAASLKVSDQYHSRASQEDLFENLETVWRLLGRQPNVNDMVASSSRFSAHVYKRRFGGVRKALEAFVSAVNEMSQTGAKTVERSSADVGLREPPARDLSERSGSRSVGWRLRYMVLKRDRFRCRSCGRSPATDPGTLLEVDHVVPWIRGGPTVEANLQTLCQRCDGGKGDT